jgi:hypothetical protein
MTDTIMIKGEREDLHRLIRQREKVMKSAAKHRSAELLDDFENQMGQQFSFDQDEVWKQATKVAEREVEKAQRLLAARCRELGIPEHFAPSLDLHWFSRGENAVKGRRQEGGRSVCGMTSLAISRPIVLIAACCSSTS